jgi:hypothetical protein
MNTTKIFRAFVLFGLSFSFPALDKAGTPATFNSGKNARDALVKALKAKLDAKSYRIKVVQFGEGGRKSTQQADYVAPDRYNVTTEVKMGDWNSGRQEMIVVGQYAYSKTAGGKWQRLKVDPQKLEFARVRDRMLIENLSKAKDINVEFSGGVQDGLQAFVYQQTIAAEPKIVTRSKTTIWVGAASGLPQKMEIVADTNFDGKLLRIKSTTNYYDYNADIRIEAPM